MNAHEPVSVYDSKEMLDVVDEHDMPLGLRKLRSEIHRDGDWHREVHVGVYNVKGEILYQLRGPHQESYPNCWDISVGGHVNAGSNYLESALRELEEELGVRAIGEDLHMVRYWHHEQLDELRHIINRAHRTVYAMRHDGPLGVFTPEEGTIKEIRFFSEKEIMNMAESYGHGASLIPGCKPYYKILFDTVREIMSPEI